jgi:hypothetical protein
MPAVYRFRVTFDDHEDVYREIEIKSNQTFEDLHRAIQAAINFDNQKDASFYVSDDHWRKGQQISLDEQEGTEERPKASEKRMKVSKLASFIEDPHQKFVYVYDPAAQWTLLVELMKIIGEDPKESYPRCSKSVGAALKQYKTPVVPPPVVDEDEEDAPTAEKIFHAEEGYDNHGEDEENDMLTEGDEEETAEGAEDEHEEGH